MKLVRADEHLHAVEQGLAAFLDTRPYEIVRKEHGPRGLPGLYIAYRGDPPPGLLGALGDAIHNFRCALDHLVWALAGIRADKSSEFPIFDDRRAFSKLSAHGRPTSGSGLHKLHDVPAVAQSIIEVLQPYNAPHGLPTRVEPLWVLQRLDIEDKHRAINLVAAGLEADIDAGSPGGRGGMLFYRSGYLPLEDGAQFLTLPGSISDFDVQNNARITIDVAFDPKGPAGGIPVRKGLFDIRDAVKEVVEKIEPLI